MGIENLKIDDIKAENLYLARYALATDVNGDGKQELLLVKNEDFDNHEHNDSGCTEATEFVNSQSFKR